jgi:hypothetical protein
MSDTNNCDNALGSSSTVQQRFYEGAFQRGKELRTMHKRMRGLAFCIAAFAISAAAQNTFPASGNVGIGTMAPGQKLEVDGGSVYVANGSISLSAGSGSAYESQLSTAYNYPYLDTYLDSIAGYMYEGRLHFRTNSGGGTMADRMVIDGSTGNVGIGTTAPAYKLDVAGQIRSFSGGIVFPDGSTQTTAFNPTICGGDYAESVDVAGARTSYQPGDVLVIDPKTPGKFLKANQAYSTLVAGIYSTKPGTVGRRQTTAKSPDEVPMAVVGIVPTSVSAENGPIQPGDLLVASSTLGRAMKGTDRGKMLGAVVGKALGNLDSGTGVIEVLVTLQ